MSVSDFMRDMRGRSLSGVVVRIVSGVSLSRKWIVPVAAVATWMQVEPASQ
ncbi:hypothetical protein SMD11_4593 [Streptomyces albireticuli]|uniref:Uncharacterized protein n=1 Tax=Streptomyces albireticuli TaxID=1940 RepID=A0A1Z2L7D3_9ACTN|nr:hypothetical protein SMD11_4593 [Streptomyces albireticuli]